MKYSSYVKSQIIHESKYLLRNEALIHQTLERYRREISLRSPYQFKSAYLDIIGKFPLILESKF